MRYLLLLFITASFYSCDDKKAQQPDESSIHETNGVSEENLYASQENVRALLQGKWSNTLEPESYIIFKGNTSTNKYREIISSENIPYTLNTSCISEATTTSLVDFRYINTGANALECYYIKQLDKTTLVMDYKKGDITLNFSRVE